MRRRCRARDARRAAGRQSRPARSSPAPAPARFAFEAESGVYNELQVGSYVFMDTDYARIGGKDGGRYTRVRAQPVRARLGDQHARRRDRAIVDAGLKSYSGEKGLPWVHGREDVELIGISDEHGKLVLGPAAQAAEARRKVCSFRATAIRPSTCTTGMSACGTAASRRSGRSRRARREPLTCMRNAQRGRAT